MNTCYVYVIESTSGHFKIGYSGDPARRMRELTRTQGPYVYHMIQTAVFSSEDFARYAESHVHRLFEHRRVNGEWFELDSRDLILLGEELYELKQVDFVHNRKNRQEKNSAELAY